MKTLKKRRKLLWRIVESILEKLLRMSTYRLANAMQFCRKFLDMRRVVAKFVPKLLNFDEKNLRIFGLNPHRNHASATVFTGLDPLRPFINYYQRSKRLDPKRKNTVSAFRFWLRLSNFMTIKRRLCFCFCSKRKPSWVLV